jgi:anti-anti-sigma factor
MADLASVDIVADGGLLRAGVRGELDAASVPPVRARLVEALAAAETGLVLDLSAVTFMDSAAVELLFGLRERLAGRGMHLTLVVPAGTPIRRTLEVTDGGQGLLELVESPA